MVVGVCAVLALAGTAGTAAYAYQPDDTGRPVGEWRPAPEPVAVVKPVTEQSRHRVGTVKKVDKLIGYATAPTRETFHYPGASYVKLHFSRMMLGPGDYLTIGDRDGTESHRYDAAPFGGVLSGLSADNWAMSITGDTAVLELHRAAGPVGALGRLGVTVDRVARGFTRKEQEAAGAGRTGREESICGGDQSADAVCYKSSDPVAYTRSRAIARLLINGTELCTGWRVGPKNRMITNNHCFATSADAYQTEVWFNYQCARCGGYGTVRPTKVWGDRVLATNRTYDYTVFTLEKFSEVEKFGFLALDTRRPDRNEELYIPQHPGGEPARIAGSRGDRAGTCAVADRAYDGYAVDSDVSYYCDTQGGSSGSPVLSRATNKVVALHHFGGCPNSGVRGDLLLAKIDKLL
jgi:hypothetical protein